MEVSKTPLPGRLAFEEAKARVGILSTSALLATAGGFLDGFTYIGHGHVFANAMTGNVVLLGISGVTGSASASFRHLPPIGAFLLGIWLALALQLRPKRQQIAPPYVAVLLAEICILLVLSLLPANTNNVVVSSIVAFISSVQVSTFREVNGRSFSSTFTTGNLRTLSEAAFVWVFEGRNSAASSVVRDFAVIVTAFFLGATGGGYATHVFGNRALWWDIGLFVLITILVRRNARPHHSTE